MAGNYQIRSVLAADDDDGGDFVSRPAPGRTRAGPHEGTSRERPSKRGDLDDNVEFSVRAVERAVENFGALKENCRYYKHLAEEARCALDNERTDRQEANRLLDDLNHDLKSEKERAVRAETRALAAETLVRELSRELDALRAHTGRLIDTISQLVEAESDARQDGEFRQAA